MNKNVKKLSNLKRSNKSKINTVFDRLKLNRKEICKVTLDLSLLDAKGVLKLEHEDMNMVI